MLHLLLSFILLCAVSGCGESGGTKAAGKKEAPASRAAKVLSTVSTGQGPAGNVTSLHFADGTLWIGTKNGLHAAAFDPAARALTVTKDAEMAARFDKLEITHLASQGQRLLAGTAFGLAVRDAAGSWATEEIGRVHAVGGYNNSIFLGRTTGIEFTSDGKGWNKLEPNPPIQRNQTSAQSVNSLAITSTGDVWAGTKFGLMRYSPSSGKWEHFYGSYQDIKSEKVVTDELGNCDLAGNYVNEVRIDPVTGKLLVSTDIGVSVFDGKWVSYIGEHTKYIVKDDNLLRVPVKGNVALPSCIVSATVLEDQTLWIGTKAGLARLAGPQLEVFDTERGMPDDSVHALAMDMASRTLFVGTEAGVAVVGYEGGATEE